MESSELRDLIHNFQLWVEKDWVEGTDGLGGKPHFVPLPLLKSFWQDDDGPDRISRVLTLCGCVDLSIYNVVAEYLCVFSTLVYISRNGCVEIGLITNFCNEQTDDHLLPFRKKPRALPNAPDGMRLWEDFNEHQYLFCPATFVDSRGNGMSKRKLSPRTVLPIIHEDIISGRVDGTTAVIKKCTLHESSNLKDIPHSMVVIKEFPPSEYHLSYSNEVRAYIAIANKVRGDGLKHFLKYYGSFEKDKKGYIILEYADQGSLSHFFKQNHLPYEREELKKLWESASSLLLALEIIHDSPDRNHSGIPVHDVIGVHQDLKPANIFVFRDGSATSYSYRFKIGDFGMSSMTLADIKNKHTMFPDNHSTKIYGAPELTHHSADLDDVDYRATWEADIWSLGCIFCELMVWTICGDRGLAEFFHLRQRDTDAVLRHKESGYSGSFHDGENRIAAVSEMITRALGRRRVFDDISEHVVDFILPLMLVPKREVRMNARGLWSRFPRDAADRPRSLHQSLVADRPASSSTPYNPRASRSGTMDSYYTAEQHHSDAGPWPDLGPPGTSPYPRDLSYSRGIHTSNTTANRYPQTRMITSNLQAEPAQMKPADQHHDYSTTNHRHSVLGAGSSRPEPVTRSATDATLARGQLLSSSRPLSERPDHSRAPHTIPELGLYRPSYPDDSGAQTQSSATHVESQVDEDARRAASPQSKGPCDPFKLILVKDVLEWLSQKKSAGGNWIRPLADYDRAMAAIRDREQVFVIDDSTSMKSNHWHDVVNTFKALSYLVKTADPNGIIELILTSNAGKRKSSRRNETNSLLEILKKQGPSRGPCNMEDSLRTVLGQVKDMIPPTPRKLPRLHPGKSQVKGVNVYIFTDGVWEGGRDVKCGVEEPIQDLTTFMKQNGKGRTSAALQFVQFGDDELAEKRLKYLDDELGEHLHFDIVDHRHSGRDGVWQMLVGSTSRENDRSNWNSGAGK